MKTIGQWLVGAIFALLAIFGLAFAANAHDGAFQLFGFVMVVFGILMLVRMITLATATNKEDA